MSQSNIICVFSCGAYRAEMKLLLSGPERHGFRTEKIMCGIIYQLCFILTLKNFLLISNYNMCALQKEWAEILIYCSRIYVEC